MSFAKNFLMGQQIAQNALDTYDKARQKRELGDIMKAEQVGMAPVTEVDTANAPTPMVNPDGTTEAPVLGLRQPVAPQQYQFLGKTYDTELTPDKLNTLRYGAVADVIGRTDPVRGLEMRRTIARDERDAKEASWREQDRTEQQNLKQARKDYYSNISKLNGNELASELGGMFSQDGSGINAMLTYDKKNNQFVLASNEPGFPTRTLTKAELLNGAMGVWEQGNGDFTRGMEMVMGTIRAQRELQDKDYARSAGLATGNADLYFKGLGAQNDAARTALAGKTAAAARENPLTAKLGAIESALGRKLTPDEILLATGVRERPQFTPKDVVTTAQGLVESGMKDPDAPNQPITMEKAMGVARGLLSGQGYQSAADRLVEAYIKNRGAQPEPAKPAAGVVPPKPQPKITTITPPRSSEEMKPKPRLSDEEILKLLSK